jgi:hypothetical protein
MSEFAFLTFYICCWCERESAKHVILVQIDFGSDIKSIDSATTWTHCILKTLLKRKLIRGKSSSTKPKGRGIDFRTKHPLDRGVCLLFERMSFGDLVDMMKVSVLALMKIICRVFQGL